MDIYNKIKNFRSQMTCPVDIFGCYKIPTVVLDKKLYVLISLILSAQTKDEINFQTMLNLIVNLNQTDIKKIKIIKNVDKNSNILKKKKKDNAYLLEKLLDYKILIDSNSLLITKDCDITNFFKENNFTLDNFVNEKNLLDLIKPVGFYNTKYKTIKNLINFIIENGYPKTLQECLLIKGVGRKMSILYINRFYTTIGMSVDTHVHRICNILKIVQTKNPDETSKKLEYVIDKDEWSNFNEILVGYGQSICKKKKPRCEFCVVSNNCSLKKLQF